MVLSLPLHVGLPQKFAPEATGGLGSAPVRTGYGGGTAAWIMGTLGVPAMQASWCPGEQEITVLLRLFLGSGSSAPVGIKCRGGVAAWITGTLAMSSILGSRWQFSQDIWCY